MAKYSVINFRQFVLHHKDSIKYISISITSWATTNEISKGTFLYFYSNELKLRHIYLVFQNHSSFSAYRIESKVWFHFFLHLEKNVFLNKYIIFLFMSYLACKKFINLQIVLPSILYNIYF